MFSLRSGGSKGGARDGRPPSVPKFLHFHAVFGKNWPNNRLAPPPFGLSTPSSGKSWIRHCFVCPSAGGGEGGRGYPAHQSLVPRPFRGGEGGVGDQDQDGPLPVPPARTGGGTPISTRSGVHPPRPGPGWDPLPSCPRPQLGPGQSYPPPDTTCY